MQPPDKILDLIEATEISAEKRNYKFTQQQQILLNRLKDKTTRKMTVSNNYWELLCDLFNEVEGRKKSRLEKARCFYAKSLMYALCFSITIAVALFALIYAGGR